MKKKTAVLTASIYLAMLLLGSSCSKDHDLITHPQETSHKENDHDSHLETRAVADFCSKCGMALRFTDGKCPNGCGIVNTTGPYHCKSCKGKNVTYPSNSGYKGSCNNCGSDPNWKGLELCSGLPCSKCHRNGSGSGSGSGSSGWLVSLFGNYEQLYSKDFFKDLFGQWMAEGGAELMLITLSNRDMIAMIEAIESGDIVRIEDAIPDGPNGGLGGSIRSWLKFRGFG